MYKKIKFCRLCGNSNLELVFDLGHQYFSGYFPLNEEDNGEKIPLQLVKCVGENNICGLLQLNHTNELASMYGSNYGYRSGLNSSMVGHLKNQVENISSIVTLEKEDIILDIGSNDSTMLSFYPKFCNLIGIDPTGEKFKEFYPDHVKLIADFFSSEVLPENVRREKAKVVSSFSMFYDLESPLDFAREVKSILHEDGIWVLEQSYMPLMLEKNAFDTICHEHLEYYGLHQINWIMKKANLRILDVEFNDINGGSFNVIVTHDQNKSFKANEQKINQILANEVFSNLNKSLAPYQQFVLRINEIKTTLKGKLSSIKKSGKSIYGLGASTKGNVLLQYFEIGPDDLQFIGEVNPEKFGRITPGSNIPIISEKELLDKKPDYLLVLPWHFHNFFKKSDLFKDVKLLFPLPEVKVFEHD